MPAAAVAREAAAAADAVLAQLAVAQAQTLEGGVPDADLAPLAAVGLDIVLARRSRHEEMALRRFARRERDRLIRQLAAEFYAAGPGV